MNVLRFRGAFALATLFLALVISCSSTDEIAKAQLTAGCLIDSDCTAPFVCAFKTCHQACNTSADCKTPAGSRCVTSGRPFNVCQAPTPCSFNTQCPGTQVCGVDDLCRDQCRADKDCTVGQKCVDLTCADPAELVDGGLPTASDGGTNEGLPCSYNSDCAAPLFCRAGYCSFQCKADVDCPLGQSCEKNVCTLPASDGGACVPATCTSLGKNCGTILDGCGGTVTCASGANQGCGTSQTCGGGGANVCGTNSCTPQACPAGACGAFSDGCANVVDCGGCQAPQSCGGAGKPGQCGCTPKMCKDVGATCGKVDDGCGGTIDCGSCAAPATCGGGGAANQCGCVKATCGDRNCGTAPDGCGGTLDCGTCAAGQNCGGTGTPNVCGSNNCTAMTTCPAGDNCGVMSDGCAGTITCGGDCTNGETCGGAGTANQCGCIHTTCAAQRKNCGTISDGCGGTLSCGTCSGATTCGGGGTPNVCGCTADPATTCNGKNCGQVTDACGFIVNCGTCAAGTVCGGGGPNVCGAPGPVKSCLGLDKTCGPTGDMDCCATVAVQGGTFNRLPNGSPNNPGGTYPAKVKDFHMDAFEVTVARFRAFVQEKGASNGTQANPPAPGTGRNLNVTGTEGVPGYSWDTSWNSHLTATTADFEAALMPSGDQGKDYTYGRDPGGFTDNYPIIDVTWYEAFAFCAWDGGWLASENEWLYAAVGGSRENIWPWLSLSATPFPSTQPAVDCSVANYSPGCANPIAEVGFNGAPAVWNGAGIYNLAGNVSEWNFDSWCGNDGSYNNDLTSGPNLAQKDCSGNECEYAHQQDPNGCSSVYWGGNTGDGANVSIWTHRGQNNAPERHPYLGFRCARP